TYCRPGDSTPATAAGASEHPTARRSRGRPVRSTLQTGRPIGAKGLGNPRRRVALIRGASWGGERGKICREVKPLPERLRQQSGTGLTVRIATPIFASLTPRQGLKPFCSCSLEHFGVRGRGAGTLLRLSRQGRVLLPLTLRPIHRRFGGSAGPFVWLRAGTRTA